MSKIIGLTGGIGSGKTTLAKYFESKGIPIYIADEEAKKIMNSIEVIDAISEQFGNEFIKNRKVDKERLAKIVFQNPEKLKILNEIVHPLVKKDFKAWLKKNRHHPLVLKETAILFETAADKECDYIITVVASKEARLKRILERDTTSKEAILNRMKNQWSDEEKIERSDFVIHNEDIKVAYLKADEILNLLKKI
jgi:dephospho-CoA kinase